MEDDGTATTNQRKLHSADFKAKVALEVVRGLMTINEVGQKFEVHPMMVRQWKKAFLENAGGVFDNKRGPNPADHSNEGSRSGDLIRQPFFRFDVRLVLGGCDRWAT